MSRPVLDKLQAHLGSSMLRAHDYRGDETGLIAAEALRPTCLWLRDTPEMAFDMLCDLTAVDYLQQGRRPRFEVVYHLYSIQQRHRLRIKVGVDDASPEIDTVSDIWRNGNWLEREVWDMYGIKFRNHPDLRRILMYEAFQGHPLRKDFPKAARQPLSRRPQEEIAAVLARRPAEERRNLV